MKQKKCKNCGNKFEPLRPLQQTCNYGCAITLSKKLKQQDVAKKWRQEKKVMKEKLKTKSDFEKYLEKEVNAIARKIDFGNPCLSCGRFGKPQAGHFHTVKANPSIRYNLFNIWIQDYYCNVKLSSNIVGYNKGLIETFGIEMQQYVECDLVRMYPSIHLSIIEIKEKTKIAKDILKSMSDETVYSTKQRVELRNKFNKELGIYKQ
jgi:predicted lipoprotein